MTHFDAKLRTDFPESDKHFPAEQDVKYSRIFAGAMWPGVRPGWVVVVGEHAIEHLAGRPCLDVLDVADSPRLDRLVAILAALRDRSNWRPVLVHPEGESDDE